MSPSMKDAASQIPAPRGRTPKPAWTSQTEALRTFLRAVRRAWIARTGLQTAWDALLIGLAASLVGSVAAGWSLRGDLSRPASLGIAAFAIFCVVLARARQGFRRWNSPFAVARALIRHPGSLPQARADELLMALELDAWPQRQHSARLTESFIGDVTRRLRIDPVAPRRAHASAAPAWRVALTAASALAIAVGASSPAFVAGAFLWWNAQDGRPPRPPAPAWSSLHLELHDPPYTQRPARTVSNPSGPLRVIAGTTMKVDMTAQRETTASRLVLTYDPQEEATGPATVFADLEQGADGHWHGSLVVEGPGSWTVVLLDPDEASPLDVAAQRGPSMALELEPDRAPEVDLLPLPQGQHEVDERNEVVLRFHARDDFGLGSAELVYQLPSGEEHRLPIALPDEHRTSWRHRYVWDISRVPIAQRSELLYWIEIRDNDAGLGRVPLLDPPGKMTRSSTHRLTIRDGESEHAANIARLTDVRNAAVDLLAARMTISLQPDPLSPEGSDTPGQIDRARELLGQSQALLAGLAGMIEAIALDTLSSTRDAETLIAIHHRLMELHREELALHERIPAELAFDGPQSTSVLDRLEHHNRAEVVQLEDEIIRLDDLVDGQIVERIETLVARLEATQRKLLEELEALKAGDMSARARIDQLQHRRREDMRRLAEARAMLREEVEREFMNVDAFQILEEIARDEDLERMLDAGKVDDALERTRTELDSLQDLRDQVQQQIGSGEGPAAGVSPEEQQRMQLLRDLSRLQDEQGSLRRQTKAIHELWRTLVGRDVASPDARDTVRKSAKAAREKLATVNDARLGRDARRTWEDAMHELDALEQLAQRPEVTELEMSEHLGKAAASVRVALEGSEASEAEGRVLRRVESDLERTQTRLRADLPPPDEVLPEAELGELAELELRQAGLERQRTNIADGAQTPPDLPAQGRKALQRAGHEMARSRGRLGERALPEAMEHQTDAWDAIQRTIDSLRQGAPPPPPPGAQGDASTEAERDRSLRDQLLDAMRERKPNGFDAPIQRYYEELLR